MSLGTFIKKTWHFFYYVLLKEIRNMFAKHINYRVWLAHFEFPFLSSKDDAERRLDVKQTFLNSLQFWKRKPVFLSVKLVFKKKKLPGIIDWTYSFQSNLTSNLRKKEIESFFFKQSILCDLYKLLLLKCWTNRERPFC